MLFPRIEVNVKSHRNYKFVNYFKNIFGINPMGATGYSCPIRLVPIYILPEI